MRYPSIILLMLISMLVNLNPTVVRGFDNGETHPTLTAQAILSSQVDSKLKQYFGISRGVNQALTYPDGLTLRITSPAPILEIIREGSYAEDASQCRAANHFHNPLLPWYSSGMADFPNAFYAYCQYKNPEYIPYYSNTTWATGRPFAGATTKISTGNLWDWDHARANYHLALTSTDKQTSDNYLASTFYGLGQVLHLLQDMAVPAHVRSDFRGHLEFNLSVFDMTEGFEFFVKNHREYITQAAAVNIINAPHYNYWDSDLYDGSNPAITALQGGLAEYTSANFFSKSTFFTEVLPANDVHYFPYPRKSSAVLFDEVGPSGEKTSYFYKDKDGEIINHLAVAGKLYKYLSFAPLLQRAQIYQDEKCYSDYSSLLLPKAVGYSAGLLNYFFRGTMDITVPSNGVYSMIDATQPGFDPASAKFTTIKLRAKNTTPNEDMTNGTIQLVVKFKEALSDPFASGPVAKATGYSYKVVPERDGVSSLSGSAYTELNFNPLGQNAIPLWATDIYLQVVFKGTLGTETDAVAVGFKDISEPTPIDIANDMDRTCLNGSWYVSGSPEAIAQVGTDGFGNPNWDIWPHQVRNVYVEIASPSDPPSVKNASPSNNDLYYSGTVNTGNLERPMYLLSDYMSSSGDYKFSYSFYFSWLGTDSRDYWTHYNMLATYNGTAVMNQDDPALCGGGSPCYIPPTYYIYRGNSMWWGGGFIMVNPQYPSNTQCVF